MEKSLFSVAVGSGSSVILTAISFLSDITPESFASVTAAFAWPSVKVYDSSVNPIVISAKTHGIS